MVPHERDVFASARVVRGRVRDDMCDDHRAVALGRDQAPQREGVMRLLAAVVAQDDPTVHRSLSHLDPIQPNRTGRAHIREPHQGLSVVAADGHAAARD
jgi:hypothetical protein